MDNTGSSLPFSRRDVVFRGIDEPDSELLMVGSHCYYSQSENGSVYLSIGVHASDAQLQRVSARLNLPLCDLVSFRARQIARLAAVSVKH